MATHNSSAALTSQSEALIHKYEAMQPGVVSRRDRWYSLAVAHFEAGHLEVALNLLRKIFGPTEKPDDVSALLLAGRICSRQRKLAAEGIEYSKRVLQSAGEKAEIELRAQAHHRLGVNLWMHSKCSVVNKERKKLEREAVLNLQEAHSLRPEDPFILFDFALLEAELRGPALKPTTQLLKMKGEKPFATWQLLALLLSGQKKYDEAEELCVTGLKRAAGTDKFLLLRILAKLRGSRGRWTAAIESYKEALLVLQQFGRKINNLQIPGVGEQDIWQDLTDLYIQLKQWPEAEQCVQRAQALGPSSAQAWHAAGLLAEARQDQKEALASYECALAMDPEHVPSMVRLGALNQAAGRLSLSVAQSFLTDALVLDPINHSAWHLLGLVQEAHGQAAEAASSFEAASVLERTSPVLPFDMITRAL
eukprot:jgi/Mesen1/7710/ME000405S06998